MVARAPLAGTAVEHFGELVPPGKYGHRLTRDMYALPNKSRPSESPRACSRMSFGLHWAGNSRTPT